MIKEINFLIILDQKIDRLTKIDPTDIIINLYGSAINFGNEDANVLALYIFMKFML